MKATFGRGSNTLLIFLVLRRTSACGLDFGDSSLEQRELSFQCRSLDDRFK